MTNPASSVLITGCSTGFGRVTTTHLLSRGWQVVATVRAEADRNSLLAEAAAAGHADRLTVVTADITRAADVAAIGDAVRTVAPSLNALVNNAGTAFPAPLELLPIDELRAQLEINVVAQLAVTQVVLPALKQGRGTLINVSSISGRIASPLVGAYSMSKFALEAMSDVLRLELIPFGIKVVLIEPGSSPTRIWQTTMNRKSAADVPGIKPYQPLVDRMREFAERARTVGFPPQLFADTVEHILTVPNPKPRYPIPGDIRMRLLIRRIVSDRMMDRLIRRKLGW
jgi:NAD(P)-dependent dehydrogenase (short-subunit alcohol dehydrogenase family)